MRNESFVGREKYLQYLEEKLRPSQVHQRLSIYGIGGGGKTAFCVELAYRMIKKHFGLSVFWVSATSRKSFISAYHEIGVLLGIPRTDDDHADMKLLVRNSLSSSSCGDWVMIIDNANDSNILLDDKRNGPHSGRLYDYLPCSYRGSILFTARSKNTAKSFMPDEVLEFEAMSRADAEQLVARRIWNKALLKDEHSVEKLLETLTCLPLAIVQAISFINDNDASISDCVSLLQHANTEVELFREAVHEPTRDTGTESTIAKTWQTSFEQIKRQDPLAAEYLCFTACLSRRSFPLSLFPNDGGSGHQAKALETLQGYGFVSECRYNSELAEGDKLFDIHPLVQKATRWWLKEHNNWTPWKDKTCHRLREHIHLRGPGERHKRVNSFPQTINSPCPPIGLSESGIITIFDRRDSFQYASDQHDAAEAISQLAPSFNKVNLGDGDILTSHSMDDVKLELQCLGRIRKVEILNGHTLNIQEVLGTGCKDTLSNMNILTQAMDLDSKHKEAEMMPRHTTASMHSIAGKNLQNTLESMTSYAVLLFTNGKYRDAEKIHKQMLVIKEMLHSYENPDTLENMADSSKVPSHEDKFEESGMIRGENVTFSEKTLHKSHLDSPKHTEILLHEMKQLNKHNEGDIISRQMTEIIEPALGKVYLDMQQKNDDVTDIECKTDIQRREYEFTEIDAETEADLEEGVPTVKNKWTHWDDIIL